MIFISLNLFELLRPPCLCRTRKGGWKLRKCVCCSFPEIFCVWWWPRLPRWHRWDLQWSLFSWKLQWWQHHHEVLYLMSDVTEIILALIVVQFGKSNVFFLLSEMSRGPHQMHTCVLVLWWKKWLPWGIWWNRLFLWWFSDDWVYDEFQHNNLYPCLLGLLWPSWVCRVWWNKMLNTGQTSNLWRWHKCFSIEKKQRRMQHTIPDSRNTMCSGQKKSAKVCLSQLWTTLGLGQFHTFQHSLFCYFLCLSDWWHTDNMYCLVSEMDITRPNKVFIVSQPDVKDHRIQDEACLFDPNKIKCHSLGLTLQTILDKHLHWIDTIQLEDDQTILQVHLQRDHNEESIHIHCQIQCTTCSQLDLVEYIFRKNHIFKFQNMMFKDTLICLFNVDVKFIEVQFVNTSISDKSAPHSRHFSESNIVLRGVMFSKGSEFELVYSYILKVHLENSSMHSVNFHVVVENLWLHFMNIFFESHSSGISVISASSCYCYFMNMTMAYSHTIYPRLLRVSCKKLHFNLHKSTFENNIGGIALKKHPSGLEKTWMYVHISDSNFFNVKSYGSGGAFSLDSFIPSQPMGNVITIVNSTFTENLATKKTFESSYGGAVSFEGQPERVLYSNKLYVQIIQCTFTNNHAGDGGGAISVGRGFIHMSIFNSTFIMAHGQIKHTKTPFVLAFSDIEIINSTLIYQKLDSFQPLVELQMVSAESVVNTLNIVVVCLPWHWMSVDKDINVSPLTGKKALKKFVSFCNSCAPGSYSPTNGKYLISYLENMSDIDVSMTDTDFVQQCLNCPYGAECPGTNLKPKSNFWGYKYEGQIIFEQCPIGFCCSGAPSDPCIDYNTCSGYRAGTLCGTCKGGYSMSMLSATCMPEMKCDVPWFWVLALAGVVSEVIWYTFKDDILAIPGKMLVTLLVEIRKQSKTSLFKSISAESDATCVDKAYFGILAYFVQAMSIFRLSLEVSDVGKAAILIRKCETFFGMLLSIELSYISHDLCPFVGITSKDKVFFKFMFLLCIHTSLFACYMAISLIVKLLQSFRKSKIYKVLLFLQLKSTVGLIEVIKYTYSGFTGVVFLSLTCVLVANDNVWFHDGSVQCFETWQYILVNFFVTYILPFPLMLVLGILLLEKGKISNTHFLVGCVVPLPILILWFVIWFTHKQRKMCQVEDRSDKGSPGSSIECASENILSSLQGPYIVTNRGSQYWESVLIFRRLLLGATMLISHYILRMYLCAMLCVLFLIHHIYTKPFKHKASNSIETVSLTLLCASAGISLIKSFYIHTGTIPVQSDLFFKMLKLVESLFLLLLVVLICLVEFVQYFKRKWKHWPLYFALALQIQTLDKTRKHDVFFIVVVLCGTKWAKMILEQTRSWHNNWGYDDITLSWFVSGKPFVHLHQQFVCHLMDHLIWERPDAHTVRHNDNENLWITNTRKTHCEDIVRRACNHKDFTHKNKAELRTHTCVHFSLSLFRCPPQQKLPACPAKLITMNVQTVSGNWWLGVHKVLHLTKEKGSNSHLLFLVGR